MPSPFVAELQRRLDRRHMSWRKLAGLVGYDPSWLSKIKNGAAPSADLVRRCDEALEAGGALIALAAVARTLHPAQLPAPPPGFTGRSGERQRIREALIRPEAEREPVVVTIDGPAGVGKTSLALRCAHDLLRDHPGRFADGQLYAHLRGHSRDGHPAESGEVLEEFLLALGVPAQEIPLTTPQRAGLYRSLLAVSTLLIVLDDAASATQVEPLLPGASACAVIITSRLKLTPLAMLVETEEIELGPMTEFEAIDVLRAVIEKARPDAEPQELVTLAHCCGCLPLALRIVAERVAAHRFHPLADLIDELASERERLDALATDDQTLAVRTAFELSYQDLGSQEAVMFRRLGLHRGPYISAQAAAALMGAPVRQARRLLNKLLAVHLIELASHGYRLHDLIRVYAAERCLAEDSREEQQAIVSRLTEWYLHTIAQGGRTLAPYRIHPLKLEPPGIGITVPRFADEEQAIRWYDAEAANFPAIMQLAADHQQDDTIWKLAVALWDYLRRLRTHEHLWVITHELAGDAARRTGNLSAEGWVITNLAEGCRLLGNHRRAQEYYDKALTIREKVGDQHGLAWTLAGSAFLAIDLGRFEQAHERARRALSIFQDVGDDHGQGAATMIVGESYLGLHRDALASRAYEDALRIHQNIGDLDGEGMVWFKMAELDLVRGDRDQALAHLSRAAGVYRSVGNRRGEAECLSQKAEILQALDRWAEARESWEAALALYDLVGDPRAAQVRTRMRTLPAATPEEG
ncbi:tetratricopeptide repeat protein [Nonomuraea typhae]|uniref:Tetratricopeptide repeat protein n=1 Tax=Nonomuraea typhae TaxID=2603600 RepID=A0ABW7YPX0_9ACTN